MGRRRRTLTLSALALAAAALFGVACGDDPKRPPAFGDAPAQPIGSPASGSSEGGIAPGNTVDGGDAGSCTDLLNTGLDVPQNAVIDDFTAASGGSVVDGVYNLTEARLFQGPGSLPGPTGFSYKGSIRITGQLFERVVELKSAGGATTETRSKGTFTPNGTTWTITLSCPTPSQEQVTYTAGSDFVRLSNLITKESFVFTRQP